MTGHRTTTRWIVPGFVVSLLLSAAVHGEEPTRQGIIAFSAECKQQDVQMNLIERFGTDFSGIDLRGVDLRGASVGLRGKHRPELKTILRGADFTNCKLQGVNFRGATLDDGDFTGADLTDANFEHASLRNVTLENANVTSTRFFCGNLAEAKMAGLDLSQSNITGASFPGADLSGCILAGTVFNFFGSVDFQNADLRDADLHGLSFRSSNFKDANLRSADLTSCDLRRSDFTGADLQGASFANAQVGEAVFHNVQGLSDAEMGKLTRAVRRYALKMKIVAFLDSFAFPITLLLVIPAVAVATRSATRRRKRSLPESAARFQFSLSSMLLLTAFTAGFIGLALLSPTGVYSFTMVCALYLMVAEIGSDRVNPKFARRLLTTALVYAAFNAAVMIVIVKTPVHRGFSESMMIFAIGGGFVGPLSVIGNGIFVWRKEKRFPALVLVAFVLWMLGMGFANLWAVAIAILGLGI